VQERRREALCHFLPNGARKVHPHRGPSRLAMLCKVILDDISGLESKALAV